MPEELKSALEIALEKLDGQEGMEVVKLTPEQKQSIEKVRKTYTARIAEQEISGQASMQKALHSGSLEEIEKIKQRLVEDKQRLHRQMEKKIEKIRADG